MENALSLDSNAIVRLTWIAFAALATTAVSITVTTVIALRRSPQGVNPADTFSKMVEPRALQMATVFLIVVVAGFLGLVRIIDSNGVVGILSGIAGYVLGGYHKESKEKKEEEKQP